MKDNILFNKSEKSVVIKDLTVSNPEVYEFLKDKKDLGSWIAKALVIGCVGLKQMVLTDNVDFVEKEFNKFIIKAKEIFEKQADNVNERIESTFSFKNTESPLYHLKQIIEEYFDSKKGKFREVIDEYFNKDKGQIREIIDNTFDLTDKKSAISLMIEELKENSEMKEDLLQELMDPNKTDSPAWQLRENIYGKLNEIREREFRSLSEKITELRENEIKDIRDEVLKKAAIETEKQKGTSKGADFEEEVHDTLQYLARSYEDKITLIGETRGIKGKKGDVLIELPNGKKVVIECKDSRGYSSKKTIEEIKESIDNRKASFGIFLFAKKEEMPSEFYPIKITDSYVITCYEKENLYLSYRLARIFVLKEQSPSGENVNFAEISREISNIEEIIKNIDNMQAKVTNIINSGDYLRSNMHSLQEGIEKSIRKLVTALGSKFDKDSREESDENEDER